MFGIPRTHAPPSGIRRSTGWDPWSAVPWELCCTTSCCSPVCAACPRGSPRWRAPGLRRPRGSRRPGESPLSSRHRPYKPAEDKLADPLPPPSHHHHPSPTQNLLPPQDRRTQMEGQKKACHWRKHPVACGAGSQTLLADQVALTAQDRALSVSLLSLSPPPPHFFSLFIFLFCFVVGYRSEATVEQQTSANFFPFDPAWSRPLFLLKELG